MSEMEPKDMEPVEEETVVETRPAEPLEQETIVETPVGDPLAPAASVVVHRRQRVYGGMWGPTEIAAAAAAVLAVAAVLILYFFWVLPSDREVTRNRAEADRLEAELISANSKYGEITNTETAVARLVSSVEDFEINHLPVQSTGLAALYQRVNGLIRSFGLVNTTGPDFTPLETVDAATSRQSEEEKGRSRFRSLYPGVYVTMTLEGSYSNIRRFIREIEIGREFIIVSSVELAPSDTQRPKTETADAGRPGSGQPNPAEAAGISQGLPLQSGASRRPQGKMHGEIVSLRIELAAYFRRANITSPAVEQ